MLDLQKYGKMANRVTTPEEGKAISAQALAEIRQYIHSAKTEAKKDKAFEYLVREMDLYFKNWLAESSPSQEK
jgi:hypothetical protein